MAALAAKTCSRKRRIGHEEAAGVWTLLRPLTLRDPGLAVQVQAAMCLEGRKLVRPVWLNAAATGQLVNMVDQLLGSHLLVNMGSSFGILPYQSSQPATGLNWKVQLVRINACCLKVPKCEIFDPFFFTSVNPIWVGDLRTGENKIFVRRLRQIFAILFFLRMLSLR